MTIPARPPYCVTCHVGVPANAITPDQHHDPAAGGCGGPVVPLPDRVDLPPGAAAIGIYAKMGQRWVLQWPPSLSVKRAQQAAALYDGRHVLELRPLYDGNPADINHLERFDLLMDLNRQLADRAMQLRSGLLEAIAALEHLVDYDANQVQQLRQLVNHARVAGLALAPAAPHPDDLAVDRWAAAMKEKLARSRAKGRAGWEDPEVCSAAQLNAMLVEHLAKGDPLDVATFAMMLWARGAYTSALPHIPEGLAKLLLRLREDGVLSEGQITEALGVDRLTCREILEGDAS